MVSCGHCKHYEFCGYYWKDDENWNECDDFELNRFTFHESSKLLENSE